MSTKKKEKTVFEMPQDEIAFLRKQVATLKGQCTKLQKDVEHYKALDKEGDELNEKRIAEIDFLKQQRDDALKDAKGANEELRATLEKWTNTNKNLEACKNQVSNLQKELELVKQQFEDYKALPWYKKLRK